MEPLLRFVHITDTHINPDLSYTVYDAPPPLVCARALVDAVNALPFQPDFILHTGDVAYDPYPEIYPTIRDLFAALPAPVIYAVGNHDDSAAVQQVLMGRPAAETLPYWHSRQVIKGVEVVVIDTNGPDVELPGGHIVDEVLAFLEQVCTADTDMPLIVAAHHNLVKLGTPWLDDWMRTINGDAAHALLKRAVPRLKGVFYGHIHQAFDAVLDSVYYSAGASPWASFMAYPSAEHVSFSPDPIANPGFSVVQITPQGAIVRRHQLAHPTA